MHKHADDKDNLSAPSHPADLMSSKENRITLDSNGGNTGYHLTGRSTPPSDRLQRLRRRKRSEVSNAPRSPHYMTGRLPRKRRSTTQSKTSTRQQSGSGHLTSTESRSAATQTTQEQDGCDVATTDLEVVDESISHRSTPKADGGSTTHQDQQQSGETKLQVDNTAPTTVTHNQLQPTLHRQKLVPKETVNPMPIHRLHQSPWVIEVRSGPQLQKWPFPHPRLQTQGSEVDPADYIQHLAQSTNKEQKVRVRFKACGIAPTKAIRSSAESIKDVQVMVHVQERLPPKVRRTDEAQVEVLDEHRLVLHRKGTSRGRRKTAIYTLNHVFLLAASSQAIYEKIEPLIQAFLAGSNVCITLDGHNDSDKAPIVFYQHDSITDLMLMSVFSQISRFQSQDWDCDFTASILDVFNEQVWDLLSENSLGSHQKGGKRRDLHPNDAVQVDVQGVKVSPREALDAMGHEARVHTARGHLVSIFTLTRTQEDTSQHVNSTLMLIDLASAKMTTADTRASSPGDLAESRAIQTGRSAMKDVLGRWGESNPSFEKSKV